MPIKNIQRNREYQREWARRKRKSISTKHIFKVDQRRSKLTLHKKDLKKRIREERQIKKQKETDIINRQKLDNLIGSKCLLCNSTKSLVTHEIYGNPHKGDGRNMYIDAFERPQDFIRVCYSCHKGIHWVMKWFNMSWDNIINIINKRADLQWQETGLQNQ